jgi:hypothetical protein
MHMYMYITHYFLRAAAKLFWIFFPQRSGVLNYRSSVSPLVIWINCGIMLICTYAHCYYSPSYELLA